GPSRQESQARCAGRILGDLGKRAFRTLRRIRQDRPPEVPGEIAGAQPDAAQSSLQHEFEIGGDRRTHCDLGGSGPHGTGPDAGTAPRLYRSQHGRGQRVSMQMRIADLVERYLEGTLDSQGRQELLGRLRADVEVRRAFLEQLDLANLVSELYRAEDFT